MKNLFKENISELNIIYNLDREIERVKSTMKELSWYKEQGYSNITLPKNLSEQPSNNDIFSAVSSEYFEKEYEESAQWIREQWFEFTDKIKALIGLSGFNLQNKYNIVLTKYGTGGSYNLGTDEVIVNIKTKGRKKVMGTIVHEIVHIGIDRFIKSHNVKHWRKERLVDLITGKYFPELSKLQNIAEDISMVDAAFKKYFPDIEVIIREIGSIE